jgi:hypothetical protein
MCRRWKLLEKEINNNKDYCQDFTDAILNNLIKKPLPLTATV